ncbi:MAG: DUF4163 domain-containing protein [Rhizobiaceae bacterium]|nr:DUF4163 domain-containing protein [Rhizobiaceae bacterium]
MPRPIRNPRLILAAPAALIAFATHPAAAFDCSKASTATEKLICANPALKVMDDAMSAAYQGLVARVPAETQAALKIAQRTMIAQREWCGDDPDNGITCALDQTLAQLRFLSGGVEPGALAGPSPALEPFLVQQAGDAKAALHTVNHAVTVFSKPEAPGETAFNDALKAMAREATLGPDPDFKEFGGEIPWDSSLSSRITLLTPEIVSAEIETYEYTGGAHGNGGVSQVSFWRMSGETVNVPALIGADGLAALFPLCRAQIVAEKRNRFPASAEEPPYDPATDSNYSDDAVKDGLAEPSLWRLEPGKATVTYNSYAVASYAEGRYECSFPGELIAALSKGALTLR